MRPLVPAFLLLASLIGAGCSNSSPVSPNAGFSTLTGDPTIGFNGLGAGAFNSSSESGVAVTTTSGTWTVRADYGNPAPFIEFDAPSVCTKTGNVTSCAPPSTPSIGAIRVTAGGTPFTFKSVDLYASLVRIPYQITGMRNSATVFTLSDTLPNTFGDFVTVTNSQTVAIDTLVITLTDAGGPMGLDNIVVAAAN